MGGQITNQYVDAYIWSLLTCSMGWVYKNNLQQGPWESMQGMGGGHSRAGIGGPLAKTYRIQMLQCSRRAGGRASRAEAMENTKSQEEGAWWTGGMEKGKWGWEVTLRLTEACKGRTVFSICHISKIFAGLLPAPTPPAPQRHCGVPGPH